MDELTYNDLILLHDSICEMSRAVEGKRCTSFLAREWRTEKLQKLFQLSSKVMTEIQAR